MLNICANLRIFILSTLIDTIIYERVMIFIVRESMPIDEVGDYHMDERN